MRELKTWIAGTALLTIAGVALAQAVAPVPAPVAAPTAAAPLPRVQALFDGYVRENKMPGIVGAFGFGDRPTVFVTAGRIADDAGAPAAGPDSLWRVYSMTKPVTAMAAMILIEGGKLKLDDPISKYFPGFAKMRVLTSPDTSLDSVPAKRQITVRNLLTHTAGLTYSINAKGPILAEYTRLGILPGATDAATEAKARPARPTTLAAFAERVATAPLIAEPGTVWHYSIGLDVLAAVVEKAAGQSFESFVQTRLFDPLGMTSSYWTVPADQVGRFATNYIFMREGMAMMAAAGGTPIVDPAKIDVKARMPADPAATSVYLKPPSFPYGGAGLVMSARDYDRFLHMLQDGGTLDGKRVMKRDTVALAMSNLLPAGVEFGGVSGNTGGAQAGPRMGFGAGGSVYLEDKPGGASKGTYGWGGAAGTVAWVDPVKRVRGTVMVNYFPADKWPLRDEVVPALVADVERR
jgi:CubicO group peptidase (beta-lactamase class C family)